MKNRGYFLSVIDVRWISCHTFKKMAFVKVEQALIPHFSKLQRQSAALHTEVIRKLLLRHVFPYARFLEPCAYKLSLIHI